MATQVKLKSPAQILGDLIRVVVTETDLTAVSAGTDVAIFLEAFSDALYEVQVASLKILETIDIDTLSGIDLDKKARSIRIPDGFGGFGRKPATQSSGPVVIGSSFEKIAANFYAGKPLPFAGQTTIYLADASSFPASGNIYVGRGTVDRFEGPIPYSSVQNNISFWTITLDAPLTKNHLSSDLIVVAQGGDRAVLAGQTVLIPATSETAAVSFTTTEDLVIPDGEAEGTVNVACTQFGEEGNASVGAITQFATLPFAGATVINRSSFRNGRSKEDDESLRQRIKTYPSTLSRGTATAIGAAIQGLTDPESGRTIQSSSVLNPVEPGDYARVFIDDGTGLEPTFDNQSYELLLESASGQETNFKAARYPITAALIQGSKAGPFVLEEGMSITAIVGDTTEVYTVTVDNYLNLSSVSALEVTRDLNSQSNILGFRTTEGGSKIVAIDLSGKAESARLLSSSMQQALGLSTAVAQPIYLYNNSKLLSFKGKTATLQTSQRGIWSLTEADLAGVRVAVDGVVQTFSVLDSDFDEFFTSIQDATISQWISVLSKKIAGVRFTESGGILVWQTYQEASPSGSLEILTTKADGSAAGWVGPDKMWLSEEDGGLLSDTGAQKDFDFNRFTGEIRLSQKPAPGDRIEIATRNTEAFIDSQDALAGLFVASQDASSVGRARLICGFDDQFAIRSYSPTASSALTASFPDSVNHPNILKLSSNDLNVFKNAEPGDWMYFIKDVSADIPLPEELERIYRIKALGANTKASDEVFSGATAATEYYTSGVSISVTKDSDTVVVNKVSHNLKTGDLIFIYTADASVGGISKGDLRSAINAGGASWYAAASTISGDATITVAKADHGFEDGDEIFVYPFDIGGISYVYGDANEDYYKNVSVTRIDKDTFTFEAHTTATSNAFVTEVSEDFSVLVNARFIPIVKINDNSFYYKASALATSNGTSSNIELGTNVFTVTYPSHGLETGSFVDTGIDGAGLAGVGSAYIDQTNVLVEKVDNNSFKVRVLAPALNDLPGEAINITAKKDCSAEIEVSGFNKTQWNSYLNFPYSVTANNLYLFKSSVTPQVVDFGTSGSLTADQAVSFINNQISSGLCEKISPRQIRLKSAKLESSSTCAVLASIGNAKNIFLPAISEGQQAHTAFSGSSDLASGFPEIEDFIYQNTAEPAYKSRGYLFFDKNITNINDLSENPEITSPAVYNSKYPKGFQHAWVTGPASGLNGRVYNKGVSAPYTGQLTGKDAIRPVNTATVSTDLKDLVNIGLRLKDIPLSNWDEFITVMDLSPQEKTVLSRMYKKAEILNIDSLTAAGSGQVINFRLKDPDTGLSFFAANSVYKDFDLTDFKMLTKSVLVYNDGSDRALILRSTDFGDQSLLSFKILLPTSAAVASPIISHTNSFKDNRVKTDLLLYLPSGDENINARFNTGSYSIQSAQNTPSDNYIWTISSALLNASLEYTAGDVLSIEGSSAYKGSYLIKQASYIEEQSQTADQTISAGNITFDPTADLPHVMTVTTTGDHNLVTYDPVNFSSTADIGGLTGAEFTDAATNASFPSQITKIDNDTFTVTLAKLQKNDSFSLVAVNGQSIVTVNWTNHGFITGNKIDLRLGSSQVLGGLTKNDVDGSNLEVTLVDSDNFTVSIPGTFTSDQTLNVTSIFNAYIRYGFKGSATASASAATLNTSTISAYTRNISDGDGYDDKIYIRKPDHGLASGQIISVQFSSNFAYRPASVVSKADAQVVYIDDSHFYYTLTPGNTIDGTQGRLSGISINYGELEVYAPSDASLGSSAVILTAGDNPISTWPLASNTWDEIAEALNSYLPESPIITAEAIGTSTDSETLGEPTYVTYPSGGEANLSTANALSLYFVNAKQSDGAGIFAYDSSDVNQNGISAVVQSEDSIFPFGSDVGGSSYSPIGEEVYIVPTNAKTVEKWLRFKATSPLNVLAKINRIDSESNIQISSREDGSDGAVEITGVSANKTESFVIGNSELALNEKAQGPDTFLEKATKIKLLNAEARSFLKGHPVKIENEIAADYLQPYSSLSSFFKTDTYAKYERIDAGKARVSFFRKGAVDAEPLENGDQISITKEANGLVEVSLVTLGKEFNVRSGDMAYFSPDEDFDVNTKCPDIFNAQSLSDNFQDPEYIGYPVLDVSSDLRTVKILAPNITADETVTLTDASSLMFIPAAWNEKNVRTNHKEGADFKEIYVSEAKYIVKKLGSGFACLFLYNDTEASSTMRLDDMLVNTDDYLILGSEFSVSNRGSFRIVAHNGRNQILYYNPSAADEVLDSSDNLGSRDWHGGVLTDTQKRSVRIIDANSVKVGDYFRISSAAGTPDRWFNNNLISSWKITGIGYSAKNNAGSKDYSKVAQFIEIDFPNLNAPLYNQTETNVGFGLTNGDATVTVTLTNHGLKTGDKITTVVSTATGGISAANLSVTNASVTVTDADTFSYEAAANATSTANGSIDFMGYSPLIKIDSANISSLGFTEPSAFSSFRIVAGHNINPQIVENRDVYLVPSSSGYKISQTYGTKVSAIGKLGFAEEPFQGIDGYKIYTGLVRQAHRVIDGVAENPVNYPGVKAAGAIVEVQTPLIKSISVSLTIRPADGVSLNSITDLVRTSVSDYVNDLGVGSPVVLSQIVKAVQSLPGVFSVEITGSTPAPNDNRIIVSDIEKAFILDSSKDITIG